VYRLLLIILIFIHYNLHADEDGSEQNISYSRGIVTEFGTTLMSSLQGAIKAGGHINALKACQIIAPETGSSVSTKYSMAVERTSLKTRNPENNPEPWQKDVLATFEQRHLSGEDISTLEFYEETETNGRLTFRYMKAIPTNELCLTCHGKHISTEITSTLNELYPDDKAIGFEAGDIRGAFTITSY
jgi:hypothetical protein